MSKIYFFRHAQASFLADNYDELSDLGKQQSQELANYLTKKQIRFDKVFVGPLHRQQQTFDIVKTTYARQDIEFPTPIILQELKEHAGTSAMKQALPQLLKIPKIKKIWANAQNNPSLKKRNTLLIFQYFMNEWVTGKIELEGVESWATFRNEVKKGLQQILEQTEKKQTIGVFTSGGTISSIIAESLHITDEQRVAALNYSIRNTSFSSFLYSKNQFNLLSANEIPHLEDDLITFV